MKRKGHECIFFLIKPSDAYVVPAGSFMTDLETDTSSKTRLAFHGNYKIIHISCKWLCLGKITQ